MPSENVLKEKQQVVAELVDKIKNSAAGVVADYKKITVEKDTKLRRDLRAAGVEYKVIKNTLLRRAFDQVGYGQIDSSLEGMTAFAVSTDDPIVAAKLLAKFAETNPDYVLKAGYVDGRQLDAAGVAELAKVPAKEELLARLVGSMSRNLTGLAVALQALYEKQSGEAAS